MKTWIFLLTIFCLLSHLGAQSSPSQYNLKIGEKYFLRQEMIQNTETDNNEFRGNVSLDLNFTLQIEVKDITPEGDYYLFCKYKDLGLGFFAPQSDISISSQSNEFIPLKRYLSKLEKNPFNMLFSRYGEILDIWKLDSIINTFFLDVSDDAKRHNLIIKTIKEGFGEASLKGISNICLHVYSPENAESLTRESTIIFNAKTIDINNKLYYLPLKDGNIRIQGLGVIPENIDSLQNNIMSIKTRLKGNQTYDLLYANENGWLIDGISKQKIQSLSILEGHPELPDGLKIPSYTETEYRFTGGRIDDKANTKK